MQMFIDGLLADAQRGGDLLVFHTSVEAQEEHLPRLLCQFRIHQVAQPRVALLLHILREPDHIIDRDQPFHLLACLLMGDHIHATIADGDEEIALGLVVLRQATCLHHPGEDLAHGVLALLLVVQHGIGQPPQSGVMLPEKLFYLVLILTHSMFKLFHDDLTAILDIHALPRLRDAHATKGIIRCILHCFICLDASDGSLSDGIDPSELIPWV